jgi:ABC-type transport system involved in multi-copper enzyme maturation permease subunit
VITLLRRSATQARYVLLGTFFLLCGIQILIVGQAEEIQRTQSFGRMAALLPAFLQRGMGSRVMLLATFKGMVSFGYFHPLICMLITGLAMYLTTETAHEVEAHLVDLELARSVPRHRLLTRSLLLAGMSASTATLLMAIGTWIGAALFDARGFDFPSLAVRARLLTNLLALAACFGAFALFLATISRRWATAFTTGTMTMVLMYMIDFLAIGWRPMRVLSWVSPFHYYPALSIIAGDASTGRDIAVLLTIATVFTVLAYWQFQRRDL